MYIKGNAFLSETGKRKEKKYEPPPPPIPQWNADSSLEPISIYINV